MSADLPPRLEFAMSERPTETQAGLLVAVVRQAERFGFFDTLLAGLALRRKVNQYSHRQHLETLVASIVVGCQHIADIQTKLVPDTAAAALFGLARFPDQSQVNAFLRALGPAQVAHLAQAHAALLARHSRAGDRTAWLQLPTGVAVLPVDLDQTYLVTRSRRAQGATAGYFGRKRGPRGYKKSVAVLGAGVQEVLWQQLESGATHGQDAVPGVLAALRALCAAQGIAPAEVLFRGDAQYGSVEVLRQVEAAGHYYVLRGYSPKTAHQLAAALPRHAVWQLRGQDHQGAWVWDTDAGEQALHAHDDRAATPPVRTRVILVVRVSTHTRKKHGRGAPGAVTERRVQYEHYVTNYPAAVLPAGAVLDVYNGRETEESYFRAEQDAFGAHYLRTHHGEGEAAFLWLVASTGNLLRWVQHTTFQGTVLERLGLARLVTQAMRLPATIVRTADSYRVLFPDTARLVRQLVAAWGERAWQLPLPLPIAVNSP
jgi:hypothetical protein